MYHINPKSGQPNICRAKTQCPFGGEEKHFATKVEARAHFERVMEGETVAQSLKRETLKIAKPSKYRLVESSISYAVEYDYDSYYCSDYACGSDGDYCRDGVYEGLRVDSVTPDQVYNHVKDLVKINHNDDLPPDLKAKIDENMATWTDPSSWSVYADQGYYGEEAYVKPPEDLLPKVKEWFYSQEGAMDSLGVLPHLRGMGFDTRGKDPLTAVKDFLAEHNGGKRIPSVEDATAVEIRTVKLSDVVIPNPQHYAKVDPQPLTPVPETGANVEVAGIILETTKSPQGYSWRAGPTPLGEVKLLDGYHRMKQLKDDKRVKGTYIVLRK